MRIAHINMIPYGSTGKIMLEIAKTARTQGHNVRTFSTLPYDKRQKNVPLDVPDHSVFGTIQENKWHYVLGSILGRNGCFSRKGTRALIRNLKSFSPDIVHLHNLHKFCIHFPSLFRYLKKSKIKVVWTLHDCWSFTGKCPHFTVAGCNGWRTGCGGCPQLNDYPRSRIDTTKAMYQKKKEWFTGVSSMTLVTPSKWLADLVKQSFLKDYPVKIIHNGIDLSIFKPTENSFRTKYSIPKNKKILLGVSFGWSYKKGLDVFVELAKRLDDSYQIVLVGTSESTDAQLPKNIISIHRTNDQKELAEIYTSADLFINATREDTFPTVNLESLACGTPVLTFRTGGSPECIDDTCGAVVECNDIDAMESEIKRICESAPYSKDACLKHARKFDMYERFQEYIELYKAVAKE